MPLISPADLAMERDAPIPTWFGVGGRAERLARPASVEDVRRCVDLDPDLRVLGDGANLLVDDDGVSELVIALNAPEFMRVTWPEAPASLVIAGAGASLPRLITESVRRGLAGLEVLGGIPATVGGAVVMNAGGRFGQICDAIARVHAVDRQGGVHVIERDEIEYGYRCSGLGQLIITSVEFALHPADTPALRRRLLEIMEYKKSTQPLADRSAGCTFRNPTLHAPIADIGEAGQRIGAGLLIDRAGCKGWRAGGAEVSRAHANFFVAGAGGRARDVLDLIDRVRHRVLERFGVALEPEVVIWRRS